MKKIIYISFMILSLSIINGQENRTGIDFKVGYNSPAFNFDDFYEGGLGLSFGVLYPFYDNMQFSLNTGYAKWTFDNTAYNLKNSNDGYQNFNLEAPITLIPLTLGIKYYATDSKVRPYVSAEFGFYYFSQTATGTYEYYVPSDDEWVEGRIPELNDSGFRTMLNVGAGVVAPLSKDWDFDLQIKMNGLFNAQSVGGNNNSGSVEGSSSTLYYISIMGGINYYYDTK